MGSNPMDDGAYGLAVERFGPVAKGLAENLRATRCKCLLVRKLLRIKDDEAIALIQAALMGAYKQGVLVGNGAAQGQTRGAIQG